MKRILCALLVCLMLCACASAPVLKEGCYLAPLTGSGGSPIYFCLESGQDTGGPAMIVGYTNAACPIGADSIALRLLEGE